MGRTLRWCLFAALMVGCSNGADDAHPDAGVDAALPDASSVPDAQPDAPSLDAALLDDAGPLFPCDPGYRPASGKMRHTITVGGREREYVVEVPAGADHTARGVVIQFHGWLSTEDEQDERSDLFERGTARGYVVVAPKGLGRSWNAGSCCGEAVSNAYDDVAFVRAMVDEIRADVCVDTDRIFATGFSNGGFLSYRLACEATDVFRAIAPVAAIDGMVMGCAPARPITILDFHGSADPIVPYLGGGVHPRSKPQTLALWESRLGCSMDRVETLNDDDTICERWSGCVEGVSFEHCRSEGAGHAWPGGPDEGLALGRAADGVDATARMLDLFDTLR